MGIASFFKKIAASIEANVVLEDYEADLYSTQSGGQKFAELEYSRFKSGESKFEIEIKRRAGIPEGDEVAVLIHGIEVARVTIQKFQTEVWLNTKNGDEVPPVKLDDKAELLYKGVVIAEGVFRPD
jgi:hypothetical protein